MSTGRGVTGGAGDRSLSATGGHPEDRTDGLIDDVIARRSVADDDAVARVAADLYALASEPLPVETRNRHLAAIHGHHVPVTAPRFSSARRRFASLAAGATATFTLFGGGAVAAAQGAAPGDLLYGLDRATERVQLAMAGDDEAVANVHLGLARERLQEADRRPEHADDLIDEAVEHAEAAAAAKGAQAITVLGELAAAKENPRAAQAIQEACLRIAERHDHDAAACGEVDGTETTEAPGRSGDAPGRDRADDGREDTGKPASDQQNRPGEHRQGGDARPADTGRGDSSTTQVHPTDEPRERGRPTADTAGPPSTTSGEDGAPDDTPAGGADTEDVEDDGAGRTGGASPVEKPTDRPALGTLEGAGQR